MVVGDGGSVAGESDAVKMLTPDYLYCPYCGHPLPDLVRRGDHRRCVYCVRCLTCEERSSKGWSKCHPISGLPTSLVIIDDPIDDPER